MKGSHAMTAQIIYPNKFSPSEFIWKLVARDIDAFWKGGLDMELGNVGRALSFGLLNEIEPIRDCWAEARKVHAERKQKGEA
jgi:hypothetical protein